MAGFFLGGLTEAVRVFARGGLCAYCSGAFRLLGVKILRSRESNLDGCFLIKMNIVNLVLSILAFAVSMMTLLFSESYKSYFNFKPEIEVVIIESNDNHNIKFLVSNSGGQSTAITRVWFSESDDHEKYTKPMELLLKDQGRLLENNRIQILTASSDQPIPSLLEEHEVKKIKSPNDLTPDTICKMSIELTGLNGFKETMGNEFRCLRASVQRAPRD